MQIGPSCDRKEREEETQERGGLCRFPRRIYDRWPSQSLSSLRRSATFVPACATLSFVHIPLRVQTNTSIDVHRLYRLHRTASASYFFLMSTVWSLSWILHVDLANLSNKRLPSLLTNCFPGWLADSPVQVLVHRVAA